MPKAIIIGASRGIGKELSKIYSAKGYILGLAGRNKESLKKLQIELGDQHLIRAFDISILSESTSALKALLAEMGEVDLVIISAGILHVQAPWEKELETIQANVAGFAAMANVAIDYFKISGKGHLAGISSVAAFKGGNRSPAYNASKAFVINYLKGLRKQVKKHAQIFITDIRPGYIATDMTKEHRGMFWVASSEKAANQIFHAIQRKKKKVYITRRWKLMAFIMRLIYV